MTPTSTGPRPGRVVPESRRSCESRRVLLALLVGVAAVRAAPRSPRPSRRPTLLQLLGHHGLAGIARLRRQQRPNSSSTPSSPSSAIPRPGPRREDRRRHRGRPAHALRRGRGRGRRASRRWPATKALSNQLVAEIESAVLAKKKIYVYGCGATGRLAKQMESAFWRPFWRRVKAEAALWAKLQGRLGPAVEDGLIGEMTGRRPGPHQLARRLRGPAAHRPAPARGPGRPEGRPRHLRHRRRRDVLGHRDRPRRARPMEGRARASTRAKAGKQLYFVYNNPDDKLRAVRAQPQGARGAGHHQDQPDHRAAGHHRLDPDAGHDDRNVRRGQRPRDGRRARPAPVPRRRRRWPGSGFARGDDRSTPACEVRRRSSPRSSERVPALARLTDLEARPTPAGSFSTYFARCRA